jgi:predicted regulator of Ras-like GTPase activity (Roadblock/LC7/MglB family)
MDADAALAELKQLSSQVEEAAILDADGSVVASTLSAERAGALAAAAAALLAAAASLRPDGPGVARVEVALPEGSVFAVVEGERRAVATTVPDPTAGLVVYDLRTCLRRLDEEEGA